MKYLKINQKIMDKYFSIWNILFLIIVFFALMSGSNILLFLLILYVLIIFYIYTSLQYDGTYFKEKGGGWIISISIFVIIIAWATWVFIVGAFYFVWTLVKFLTSK